MTEALQAEELNIVDAMTIIKATVDNLRRINEDSHAMDAEIHAGIMYARKLGGDPEQCCIKYFIFWDHKGNKKIFCTYINVCEPGDHLPYP